MRGDRDDVKKRSRISRQTAVTIDGRSFRRCSHRLARSLRQLLTTVDTEGTCPLPLDTTSATGRLILHIFAALGQFEVELCVSAPEQHWQPAALVVGSVAVPRH